MAKKKSKESPPIVEDQPSEEPRQQSPNDNGDSIGYNPVPGAPRKAKKGYKGSILWIYGALGVGKTTLAAQFPGPWFIATEPGQKFIDTREPTIVDSWTAFLELCAYIQEHRPTHFQDGKPIETIVIDTADRLFRMCNEYVCAGLGVEDPGELGHGKGWSRLTNEFSRVIGKVALWPYTLVCISHEVQKEFKSRRGNVDRYQPEIGAAGLRELGAAADFIFRAFIRDEAEIGPDGEVTGKILERRFLQLQPSASAVGKNRDKTNQTFEIELDFQTLVKTLGE